MKKSAKKTGRSIRPARSPVLAIRIPAPIYDELKKAAKTAGATLSEYVAQLIIRGQEWQETIGDARKLLAQAKAEADRIPKAALEAEMRRQNWRLIRGKGWQPSEMHRLPPHGLIAEPETTAIPARVGNFTAAADVLDP